MQQQAGDCVAKIAFENARSGARGYRLLQLATAEGGANLADETSASGDGEIDFERNGEAGMFEQRVGVSGGGFEQRKLIRVKRYIAGRRCVVRQGAETGGVGDVSGIAGGVTAKWRTVTAVPIKARMSRAPRPAQTHKTNFPINRMTVMSPWAPGSARLPA